MNTNLFIVINPFEMERFSKIFSDSLHLKYLLRDTTLDDQKINVINLIHLSFNLIDINLVSVRYVHLTNIILDMDNCIWFGKAKKPRLNHIIELKFRNMRDKDKFMMQYRLKG